ncbi:hypothetical protein cyc_07449 [Cyclospora cayetanensis]|uniref:Uncharacterized protein n=1 Tax=Cyclospora cayetanensis TaxID=88456 RepID=A0A1D3CRT2_9EIME|nr:hypothetical protein cyc_07449 [Cyclospora cayetanensis]
MEPTNNSSRTREFSAPESEQGQAGRKSFSTSSVASEEGLIAGFISRLSSTFGIPLGSLQSRPEIQTSGEEVVADPSMQPRTDQAPRDYGSGLPGYPKHSCAYFDSTFGRSKDAPEFVSLFKLLDVHDDRLIGPRLSGFPKCKLNFPPLPADKLGTPTYDYRDLIGYRMDFHPYVNATMNPEDPARMYVCANWMVGYPYGVPAVEENERAQLKMA